MYRKPIGSTASHVHPTATLVPCVVNAMPTVVAEQLHPRSRKSSCDADRDFSPTKLKHSLSERSRDSEVDNTSMRNSMEAYCA